MDRYVLTARLMFDTWQAANDAADDIESYAGASAAEVFIEEV